MLEKSENCIHFSAHTCRKAVETDFGISVTGDDHLGKQVKTITSLTNSASGL